MTGQLPLAIAELLIECIPALGATSDDDATAMTPVLHPPQTPAAASGINRMPPSFSDMSPEAPPRLPGLGPPAPASCAQLLERALEVLILVGGSSCVCSGQRVGFRGMRSGGCVRAWGVEVEGGLEYCALNSVSRS